ncbi:MAG: LptE family protein [Deltaproteobacteria bacterium]|nr:LptE family protein [Deltaproteobacteria bacterium]
MMKKSKIKNQKSKILFWLFLFTIYYSLFTALSGCGYHIAGKDGKFPGDIKTVSIPFFKNETQKPDVESVITPAVVDEFVISGIVKVVSNGEATISGTIKDYKLSPVSFNRNDLLQEYRLTIRLELSLVRKSDGKILWQDKNFTDYEDFRVTSDITATKTAEWEALKKMAKDSARLIKERMLEDF